MKAKLSLALLKPYTVGICNPWIGFHPQEKLSGVKKKVANILNKVWKAEQTNTTSTVKQVVKTAPIKSLFQLQRFQTTIKGRAQIAHSFNDSFFTGAFARNFISKRMKFAHLIAFSTLMIAKEEKFKAFDATENRLSAYEKICKNIKCVINNLNNHETKEHEATTLLTSIKELAIKDLISVGSNGIVFSASQDVQSLHKEGETTTENSQADDFETKLDNKTDLALKMIFNFGSSDHFVIKRMVESELLTCDYISCCDGVEKWQMKKHSRMKLPPHSNILKIKQAIIDQVPAYLPQSRKYIAVMPNISHPKGHGRSNAMFLVMKKYPLTLKQLLNGKMITKEARPLLCLQLLQAAAHLEKHFVIHRDLKSENILIEFDSTDLPRLVIGDLGCSLIGDCSDDLILPLAIDIRDGTPSIQPPEVMNAVVGRTSVIDYRSADAWAVGGLLCEILGYGNPLEDKVKRSGMDKLPRVWKYLIKQLLDTNKETRISSRLASDILYLQLFGPLLQKTVDATVVCSWLLMHAAEYHVYRNLPWGANSVICDLFYNFLTAIDSERLEYILHAWLNIKK